MREVAGVGTGDNTTKTPKKNLYILSLNLHLILHYQGEYPTEPGER